MQKYFMNFADSSVRITCIGEQMIPNQAYKLRTAVDCILQLVKGKVQIRIPKNTVFIKMLRFRERFVAASL